MKAAICNQNDLLQHSPGRANAINPEWMTWNDKARSESGLCGVPFGQKLAMCLSANEAKDTQI